MLLDYARPLVAQGMNPNRIAASLGIAYNSAKNLVMQIKRESRPPQGCNS